MSNAVLTAYTFLKEQILNDRYVQGQPLRETELARQLGISRTPIREALSRLEAQGYVYTKPNRGTFVAHWTPVDIFNLFTLRVSLETAVTRSAARLISPETIETLNTLQDDIERQGPQVCEANLTRISAQNLRFHTKIAEASNNRYLIVQLKSALERPVIQRTFNTYTATELQQSFLHHRELIRAFRAHDPDWASAAMECHIRAAQDVLRRALTAPA